MEVSGKNKTAKGIIKQSLSRVEGISLNLKRETDFFGNTHIISPNKENINGVYVSPRLVISQKGAELFELNPRLRSRLKGALSLDGSQIVGEGREAVVIATPPLKVDNKDNYKRFATKYTSQTSSASGVFSGYITFTSGVDAMLLAQFISQTEVLPSIYEKLNFLVPLIASNTMTLSPMKEKSLPLDLILKKNIPEIFTQIKTNQGVNFDSDAVDIAVKIREQDEKLIESKRFLPLVEVYSVLGTAGLAKIIKNLKKESKIPFKFILPENTTIYFHESEIARNKLIQMDLLNDLWETWVKNKMDSELFFSSEHVDLIRRYGLNISKGKTDNTEEIMKIREEITPKQKAFLEEVSEVYTIIELMIGAINRDN